MWFRTVRQLRVIENGRGTWPIFWLPRTTRLRSALASTTLKPTAAARVTSSREGVRKIACHISDKTAHLYTALEVNLDEVTVSSLRKRVAQDLRVEIRGDDKDWRGPAPDTPSTCLTVIRTQVQGAGRGAHLCRAGARSEHAGAAAGGRRRRKPGADG